MTIQYTGGGLALTTVPQVLCTASSTVRSSNVLHLQITNLDELFMRSLNFWLKITGGRELIIADNVAVDHGVVHTMASITLMPGESLTGWSETTGLVNVAVSLGEQK